MSSGLIALVAIVRSEDPFLDEWIAYHRLLGIDQFVLYDDDPRQNLEKLVKPYSAFTTVMSRGIPATVKSKRNRQTMAYEHALSLVTSRWVVFLDCDEFIVLRQHNSLGSFLSSFEDAEAVILTWHMFGHCGFYQNPPGLITESLVKRQAAPGNMMKSIVLREAITLINSAHVCHVKNPGAVYDANHRHWSREQYPGKTANAHINHYFCRSFSNWMARVERGEVAYDPMSYPPRESWRFEREACLQKFVEISAMHNEIIDDYLVKFAPSIRQFMANSRGPTLQAGTKTDVTADIGASAITNQPDRDSF